MTLLVESPTLNLIKLLVKSRPNTQSNDCNNNNNLALNNKESNSFKLEEI